MGYLNLLANSIDNFTHGLAVAGSFIVSTKVSWDVALVGLYVVVVVYLCINQDCYKYSFLGLLTIILLPRSHFKIKYQLATSNGNRTLCHTIQGVIGGVILNWLYV